MLGPHVERRLKLELYVRDQLAHLSGSIVDGSFAGLTAGAFESGVFHRHPIHNLMLPGLGLVPVEWAVNYGPDEAWQMVEHLQHAER